MNCAPKKILTNAKLKGNIFAILANPIENVFAILANPKENNFSFNLFILF